MLEKLKSLNPDIAIYDVTDKEFSAFGRVIHGLDVSDIIKEAGKIPYPESGSAYVPTVDAFEKLPVANEIQNSCFGTLPTQIGYCWGHNRDMNATEWHFSSEINIAVTPLVLILGNIWDVQNGKIDASKFKAFYVPAGTVVEGYATTLHYCPCEVREEGFGWVVGLPKGTNTPLDEKSKDPLLFSKNKWLIAHTENEALIAEGAVPGITGSNYRIHY